MANTRVRRLRDLEFSDPGFRAPGRMLLGFLSLLPNSLREALLFSESRFSWHLQKLLRRSLGGSWPVKVRFLAGPLRGMMFECLTSEKYFMLGSYFESDVVKIAGSNIRSGECVYDVGAHAGFMTLYFSRLCGPNGQVFSFEPSPTNYIRLKRNIELNQKAQVTTVNLAASDSEGLARWREQGSMSTIIVSAADATDAPEVPTVQLDDFVFRDRHPKPTFVKIDVEGHAGQCLAGMTEILKSKPRLLLELHDDRETSDVLEILCQNEYRIQPVDGAHRLPRRVLAIPPSNSTAS